MHVVSIVWTCNSVGQELSERGLVSAIMLNKVELMKEELQKVVLLVNRTKNAFNWNKAGTSQKVLGPDRHTSHSLVPECFPESPTHQRDTTGLFVLWLCKMDRQWWKFSNLPRVRRAQTPLRWNDGKPSMSLGLVQDCGAELQGLGLLNWQRKESARKEWALLESDGGNYTCGLIE